MNCKILLFALVVLLVVGVFIYSTKREGYENPSKCFDCEEQMVREYGEEARYMAGPTKCFSCEKDLIQRSGGNIAAGAWGQPSKCFDCGSSYKPPTGKCNGAPKEGFEGRIPNSSRPAILGHSL